MQVNLLTEVLCLWKNLLQSVLCKSYFSFGMVKWSFNIVLENRDLLDSYSFHRHFQLFLKIFVISFLINSFNYLSHNIEVLVLPFVI